MLTRSVLILAAAATCAPREAVVEQLESKHSERLVARGLQTNTTVMEVFASDAGTYTVLLSNTAGISCIVGSGVNWTLSNEETPTGVPL